jgi:hypothetical protein
LYAKTAWQYECGDGPSPKLHEQGTAQVQDSSSVPLAVQVLAFAPPRGGASAEDDPPF